jgi:geranylgeranyl diphosphate synthase type II
MYTIKECQEMINKKLAGMVLPEQPANLYDPIRYVVQLEGKRIRPALVLMGCNLFVDSIEDAINPAIAVELFHNFTLMHDDIMDQSDLRRNRPTVHKKWNVNIGILSGDAMMIKAYDYLAISPSTRLSRMLEVFNKTALEVCEGQQFDMDFESTASVSLPEYLHMIELKTAVLLAASLKIGAISAASSEKDAGYLADFGRNIGIAFQLQDDLLDVYGTLEQFGKQPGNDIVSNKKTFLLLTALNRAEGEMLRSLRYWIEQKHFNRDEKVSKVISIFDALQINEITENKINSFYDLGIKSLEKVSCNHMRKQPLVQFAEMLMSRRK